MRHHRPQPTARFIRNVALLHCLAGATHAQIIRGVVRDPATGAPVSGALITLIAESESEAARVVARTTLAREDGEFAIAAPSPGRYRLLAKRVGFAQARSEVFSLTVGESRRIDLALNLARIAFELDRVVVSARRTCTVGRTDAGRVAYYWQEVRAALTSAHLAAQARLLPRSIDRYVRRLSADTMTVIAEVHEPSQNHSFASAPPATLSTVGYVVTSTDGTIFLAPDISTLLSEEFFADHCYAVSARVGATGLVGLSFQPTPGRRTPDIRGTIWIDSATSELRAVDFRYVGLPRELAQGRAHGETQFARSSSGTWFVRKWFVRMPLFEAGEDAAGRPRVSVVEYQEEGGETTGTPASVSGIPGSVEGVARDSSGNPLVGAVVRVSGSSKITHTDSLGRFRLSGLHVGTHTILLEAASYDSLSLFAGQTRVRLDTTIASLHMRAATTTELNTLLCGRRDIPRDTAVAQLTVRDQSGHALHKAKVRYQYLPPRRLAIWASDNVDTNRAGTAAFCSMPWGIPITFSLLDPDEPKRREARARVTSRLREGVVNAVRIVSPD